MQKLKISRERKNPFLAYQRKRQKESAEKVQAAIAYVEQVKGNVSYNAVAKLAKMTLAGLKRNKECCMLVERAKARQKGSKLPVGDVTTAMPRTLDDAGMIIGLLRVQNRELRTKLLALQKFVSKYKFPDESQDMTFINASPEGESLADVRKRVITAILDEGVYRLTPNGILDAFNKVVVTKQLLEKAEIPAERK